MWRPEFQQVDNEYMETKKENAGCVRLGQHPAESGSILQRRIFGRGTDTDQVSAYRAASMAEKRATFSLRRRRSLGFS